MNVTVEYTGQLQSTIGRAAESITLGDGATIAQLFEHLEQHGRERLRPHLRTAGGQWQPSLLVAINGTAHAARQAAAITLHEGDTVTLLPPIGGG